MASFPPRTRLRCWAGLTAPACLLTLFVAGAAAAGSADPSFAPSRMIPIGHGRVTVAVADLNGDGSPDVSAADNKSDNVSILLGNGAGGFRTAPGSPIKVGNGPVVVASADFNNDGKADLAVANEGSKDVTVLLGDGTGGFSVAPRSPVKVGGSPESLTTTDLNGDGRVDLVLGTLPNRVTILLGDGSGGFAQAPGSPLAVGGNLGPIRVAVGDFNGDRKPDLTVGNGDSSKGKPKGISIFLGNGAGGFHAATSALPGTIPESLAVADLNHDGKLDLAFGNLSSNAVTILLGNGAGGFRRAASYRLAADGDPAGIAIADLNGDGNLDLPLADGDSNDVTVLLGNGTGRFRPATDSPFPLPARPFFGGGYAGSILTADLNGDGRPDLVGQVQWNDERGGKGGLVVLWQTPSTPVTAPGGALPRRGDAVFSTRGLITKLAADGNRVAVVTTKRKDPCGRVVVWTVPGRKSKSFKAEACGSILCSETCVDELALGGGQVAWIARSGGNNLELRVYVAKLSGRAAREIDFESNSNGAGGDLDGDWVGQLLGGGPLLVYNRWSVVCSPPAGYGCDWSEPTLRLAKQMLVRIAAGRLVVVKRGAPSFPLSAVGGGRMAVESAGAVTVLAPSGSRVATVPAVETNPPRVIALTRTLLAVERTLTLDLYNPATGSAAKALPLGPSAALQLAGLNSKLALLIGPHRLGLVRLSDGKLISIPLRSKRIVGTKLTAAGLFYAYNAPRRSAKGRIVFEPMAKLLSRF